MNSAKPGVWAAGAVIVGLLLWAVYSQYQYFNGSFLGALLLVEVLGACLWKFETRFFPFLMIAFVWAGMNVPMQGAWTGARWLVLAAGTIAGLVTWMKKPQSHFKTMHLLAVFCILAAFVSASVSSYVQMASLKALSLLLLFLYGCSGVRLAALGREQRFFAGLVVACEIVTFGTAICYFVTGHKIWGNPNSLGAAMSIGIFPILLWGWFNTEGPLRKAGRLLALILCAYLVYFSMARAGMVAMIAVTLVFCFCLRQYRLLAKAIGCVLFVVAISGMVAPDSLNQTLSSLGDAILYKGHKTEGIMGSRKTPWQDSIDSIKEHPLFGTGYGTSPTGEDPGLNFGKFSSSQETVREHGSSYMTIAEWVGILGVAPFALLLLLNLSNVRRVCSWMRRTSDPTSYSIPLAMVLVAGFVHAGFEDWMFAVGSYPSVYFWSMAFLLGDLVPAPELAEVPPLRVPMIRRQTELVAAARNQ
jgi:O-antigen ligase